MIRIAEEPAQNDLTQLLDEVDAIFAPDGILTTEHALEHRPQQALMADAVTRNLLNQETLLFEAGTGVGKSLAYLIPGIMHAVSSGRPLVVSTHTHALQHQIQSKDLKLCRHLFEETESLERYASFKVALLVGRRNYLCPYRLAQAIHNRGDLFPGNEEADLERIAIWSTETKTGLLEELNPPPMSQVWEWVNADASACNRKNCSHKTCFYRKARAQIQEAQVIIVNHSLLFSLVGAGATPGKERGVLFAEDCVILDEAHTVPDIATDNFGLRISSAGVDRALKLLYNPKRKRGLLKKQGTRDDIKCVSLAITAAENFFIQVRELLLKEKSIVRIHEPEWIENTLTLPLKNLADALGMRAQRTDNETLQEELKDHRTRILGLQRGIDQFIELQEKETHVHWVERGGAKGTLISLRSAPIDVAPYLKRHVFERGTAVTLTSATLSTGQSTALFQNKVGAQEAEVRTVTSPFDYENNVQTFVATDAPEPSRDASDAYVQYLAKMITQCATQIKGGTLVLFTSYHDMRRVARLCAESLRAAERPLWVQGEGSSRSEITAQFKKAGNGVLMGTDSFWTGVDVPGAALSQVILTRLPFRNPGHPLLEAKHEWVRERGGNPFADITLPEALIQFRQGIGRLIRKQSDTGVITILDSRIVKKPYGRHFLASLPKEAFTRINSSNCEAAFSGLSRMGIA